MDETTKFFCHLGMEPGPPGPQLHQFLCAGPACSHVLTFPQEADLEEQGTLAAYAFSI